MGCFPDNATELRAPPLGLTVAKAFSDLTESF